MIQVEWRTANSRLVEKEDAMRKLVNDVRGRKNMDAVRWRGAWFCQGEADEGVPKCPELTQRIEDDKGGDAHRDGRSLRVHGGLGVDLRVGSGDRPPVVPMLRNGVTSVTLSHRAIGQLLANAFLTRDSGFFKLLTGASPSAPRKLRFLGQYFRTTCIRLMPYLVTFRILRTTQQEFDNKFNARKDRTLPEIEVSTYVDSDRLRVCSKISTSKDEIKMSDLRYEKLVDMPGDGREDRLVDEVRRCASEHIWFNSLRFASDLVKNQIGPAVMDRDIVNLCHAFDGQPDGLKELPMVLGPLRMSGNSNQELMVLKLVVASADSQRPLLFHSNGKQDFAIAARKLVYQLRKSRVTLEGLRKLLERSRTSVRLEPEGLFKALEGLMEDDEIARRQGRRSSDDSDDMA